MTTTDPAGRIRLGFFTYVEGHEPAAVVYRQVTELFAVAEELGFDTGWVAQHHFNHQGGLPSPFVFYGTLAERTTRIDLGTALIVLPLNNGVRVAEDAAVFEALHPGRLQFGTGTGGPDGTAELLGYHIPDRRQDYEEKLAIVRAGLGGVPVDDDGTVLHPSAPQLLDRLWEGTASVAGAEAAGRRGAGLLLSRTAYFAGGVRTPQAQLPLVDQYHASVRAAGFEPRLGLSRSVYPARDRRTAEGDLREGVFQFHSQLARFGAVPAVTDVEDVFAAHHIHYGHPDQIIQSLREDEVLPHATELICQVQPGQPTFDQTVRALELIAREVAPALGWVPAGAAPVAASVGGAA